MGSWRTHRMRTQKRFIQSTANGAPKIMIESNRSAVLSCEFHKSGQFLVSSNSEGQIHICLTDSASENSAYLKGHREAVTEVHFSPDGLNIYSSSLDQTIGVWDASRCVRKAVIIGHNDGVNTVHCSPSARPLICSGSSDKTIRVWDIRQRDCSAMFRSHQEVTATCFSGCGRYIYCGGFTNGDITAWDIRQNDIVHLLAGHGGAVTGLSLSPSRKYLASCSADGTLRKWDISSPAEIETEIQSFPLEQGDSSHLRRCTWSPNGKLLSAGISGSQVVVLDSNSGERLYQLDGHSEDINDVSFHPKKKMLCSAGADKKLIMHYL